MFSTLCFYGWCFNRTLSINEQLHKILPIFLTLQVTTSFLKLNSTFSQSRYNISTVSKKMIEIILN